MTPTSISITPQTATRINKALAVLAIAAFAAAAITIFPSFGPSTAANAAPLASKGDRLNVAAAEPTCAEQNWPNLNSSCLRGSQSHLAVKPVRFVTADKL